MPHPGEMPSQSRECLVRAYSAQAFREIQRKANYPIVGRVLGLGCWDVLTWSHWTSICSRTAYRLCMGWSIILLSGFRYQTKETTAGLALLSQLHLLLQSFLLRLLALSLLLSFRLEIGFVLLLLLFQGQGSGLGFLLGRCPIEGERYPLGLLSDRDKERHYHQPSISEAAQATCIEAQQLARQ